MRSLPLWGVLGSNTLRSSVLVHYLGSYLGWASVELTKAERRLTFSIISATLNNVFTALHLAMGDIRDSKTTGTWVVKGCTTRPLNLLNINQVSFNIHKHSHNMVLFCLIESQSSHGRTHYYVPMLNQDCKKENYYSPFTHHPSQSSAYDDNKFCTTCIILHNCIFIFNSYSSYYG